jgi:hypothetical protein
MGYISMLLEMLHQLRPNFACYCSLYKVLVVYKVPVHDCTSRVSGFLQRFANLYGKCIAENLSAKDCRGRTPNSSQ